MVAVNKAAGMVVHPAPGECAQKNSRAEPPPAPTPQRFFANRSTAALSSPHQRIRSRAACALCTLSSALSPRAPRQDTGMAHSRTRSCIGSSSSSGSGSGSESGQQRAGGVLRHGRAVHRCLTSSAMGCAQASSIGSIATRAECSWAPRPTRRRCGAPFKPAHTAHSSRICARRPSRVAAGWSPHGDHHTRTASPETSSVLAPGASA